MARSDSIISVYNDYQMDPSFYRLRSEGSFAVGGGSLDAEVVFVQDISREPSGLAEVLAAEGFSLDSIYLTALVKYAVDRLPMPQEVRDSRPYLRREMGFLSPKVICPLGPHALGSYLKTVPLWSVARGRVYRTNAGTPVVPVMYAADFAVALKCLENKEFQPRGQ